MSKHRAVSAAITGVVTFGSALAPAATWVPATGNWGTAANWTPADVPDTAGETATLNTGTTTLDASYTIGTLNLGGGTVVGAPTLTAATLAWTAGTMSGTGGTGTTTITGASTLTLGNYVYVDGRTLNLQGNTAFASPGGYTVRLYGGGATVNNNATFTLADNSTIDDYTGTNNTFNNNGTLQKTGGTGTLNVAAVGTHTLAGTATFSGVNTRLTAGTFTAGGPVSAAAGSNVTLAGAAITGSAWQFADLTWTSGTMTGTSGTGTTTVTGASTLTLANYIYVDGRTLNLQGNTTLSAPGGHTLRLYAGGATVNNNATFSITDNASIDDYTGTNNTFNNNGTLQKTGGTGTSAVQALVNNGTVSAQSGTLSLQMKGGGTSTGAFNSVGTATLLLAANGTHTFNSTVTLSGSNTRLTGGTFVANGTVAAAPGSTLTLAGAVITGNPWQFDNLVWTTGTMTGTGGTGTTTVTGTSTFTLGGYIYVDGRTLNLQGNTTLSAPGGHTLRLYAGGATINNTATFSIIDNSSVDDYTGANNTFNNSGVVQKTGGAGAGAVQALVNNGSVSVSSGTLNLQMKSGGTSAGSFASVGTATLQLAAVGTHTFTPTATFTGTNVRLAGGTLAASGTVAAAAGSTVTLAGAVLTGDAWQFNNFTWTTGTLTGTSGTGTTTVTGASTFTLGGYVYVDGRTLTLQGNTTLSAPGGHTLRLYAGGATINNNATFSVVDDASVDDYTGANNTFNNNGVLQKTGGVGTSAVQAVVNNGTVSAQSGTLSLLMKAGATSAGVFGSTGTATLNLSTGGTHTLSPAATFTGTNAVRFTAGTFDLQGSRTIATPVAVAGGVLRIGTATDTFSALTFAGAGKLDVATGIAFINNGGGAANLTTAKAQVAAGTYFTSSADTAHRVGYGDTGTSIKVRYTLNGDADLDGDVDIADFNALAINFGKTTGQFWANGDFDYNSNVTIGDFNLLATQFGKALGLPAAVPDFGPLLAFAAAHDDLTAFAALTGVPEPTTLGLLAAGATLGLRRRTGRGR